ncbi:MAG: CoA-binding protein [Rhodobacteraceae bacterium]|nr:CoA-binding protein [Paracoccaceae bacterium]
MNYTDNFLRDILTSTKTVAMVGISTNPIRPSYFVGRYLNLKGYRVIPVNPMYPDQTLFNEPIRAALADIPDDGPIEMLDIFRRPEHVLPIVEEAIEALLPRGLKTVWMQIGAINDQAAKLATDAGLNVVMDRCPKIEHQRLFGELRKAGFNTGIISSKLAR